MKIECLSILFIIITFAAGCSISPEKPVSRQELYKTNIFSDFAIKDSPESVLATLNHDGEAILEGKTRFGEEYFIKLLATSKGLKVRFYAK
jgi:hypothetical protein